MKIYTVKEALKELARRGCTQISDETGVYDLQEYIRWADDIREAREVILEPWYEGSVRAVQVNAAHEKEQELFRTVNQEVSCAVPQTLYDAARQAEEIFSLDELEDYANDKQTNKV